MKDLELEEILLILYVNIGKQNKLKKAWLTVKTIQPSKEMVEAKKEFRDAIAKILTKVIKQIEKG